jgi:prepilin-type N-terminal cleavage/methylation domain-containing protein
MLARRARPWHRASLLSPRRHHRGHGGFSLVELMVALSLLAGLSLFIMQVFVASMAHSGRTNEQAAAMAVATQVMEQVQASVNPYAMVGFAGMARTSMPLPAPYTNVVNPSPYPFDVAVIVTPDVNLTIRTVVVQVFRPADATPYITLGTILDDL